MDIIFNKFLQEVTDFEKEKLKDLDKYKEQIKERDSKLEKMDKKTISLQQNFDKLEKKNKDLQEELTNLNKVSLLKSMHVKYDKLKHRNGVLKQRVAFYKRKLLKNDVKMDDTIDLTSSEFDVISQKDPEKPKVIDLSKIKVKKEPNQEEVEISDDEEINVELKKIKKRFYYIDSDGGEVVVYKAIKIKKGEYDVGDRIGILLDGKIVKD